MMKMSYPGAVSATKMPPCAATAAMGTSTASAAFGKACRAGSQVSLGASVPPSYGAEKQPAGGGDLS